MLFETVTGVFVGVDGKEGSFVDNGDEGGEKEPSKSSDSGFEVLFFFLIMMLARYLALSKCSCWTLGQNVGT